MNSTSALRRNMQLKKAYRINMAIGFGVSVAAHLLLVFTAVLFLNGDTPIQAKIMVDSADEYKDIVRIQGEIYKTPKKTPRPVTAPPSGEIIAVPDEAAPEDINVPTTDELFRYASYDPMDWQDGEEIVIDVNSIINEILPPRGTFVPFEEPPQPVRAVDPVYPELPRKAGLEADIWLEVLIDENGTVRDVAVVEPSENQTDFEKASIDAAYKGVWKPAIANGQPTAVWVTYKVSFRLK